MAVWDPDAELQHPFDYQLVKNGFVTLYHRVEVLRATIERLEEASYDVRVVDASEWPDERSMHETLARTLEFPDYYGHNLAALNDCLSDVATDRAGMEAGATGLVLVLVGFDTFSRRPGTCAHALLDIVAGQALRAALFGNRMLCLVQSHDPDLVVAPVGATAVSWNAAEWLDRDRRR